MSSKAQTTDDGETHILSAEESSQMAQMYAIKYFEEKLPQVLYGRLQGSVLNLDGHEEKYQTYSQLLRATQEEHGKGYFVVNLTLNLMINMAYFEQFKCFPYGGCWAKANAFEELPDPQHREAVRRVLTNQLERMNPAKDLVVLIEFTDAGCCFGFLMGDALTTDVVDRRILAMNKVHTVHPDESEKTKTSQ
ncbi:MAG: hypothetical protein ACXABY_08075 [Candidatus Thorarchaeota archaeon]|jgi:hypothetical protein